MLNNLNPKEFSEVLGTYELEFKGVIHVLTGHLFGSTETLTNLIGLN